MTKSEQVLSLLDVDQFSIEVYGKTGLGLDYSDEGVELSCTFVLLCPRNILEDGTMIKCTEFEDPRTYAPYFSASFLKLNPTLASFQTPQDTQNP